MAGNDLITVGRVLGAHGVKGWVRIRSFTDPEEQLFGYAPLYLMRRTKQEAFDVEACKALTKGWSVKLKGVDDRNAAELLQGAEIAMPSAMLPELAEDEFYWRDLIGMTVVNKGVLLGVVSSMLETGANDVLVVKSTDESVDEQERLIPFLLDRFVVGVDKASNTIEVDWDPEW
ncbi:MAG: ribosome maturation factor RimM [Halieaceae bacterium]|nr:ribosome maturation factor RimM [Halieaceae bacterium]